MLDSHMGTVMVTGGTGYVAGWCIVQLLDAGYDVVAALYLVTGLTSLTRMLDVLRAALEKCPEVIFGASELPNACGVGVRVLGSTSLAVQAALRSAWTAARLELLGAPPPNLRKG